MCGDEITMGERYQDPQQEAERLKAETGDPSRLSRHTERIYPKGGG
jgi:hypothetical protein